LRNTLCKRCSGRSILFYSDIILSVADVGNEPGQGRDEKILLISERREMSISWQNVSKAALRSSIKMFINPESMDRRISLTTRRRVVSVL